MLHIQATQPAARFEETWRAMWDGVWERGRDVSKPEDLAQELRELGYSEAEIDATLAATKDPEIKARLEANTKRAVELGAFGAPFFSVTSDRTGTTEPFFGSDRFGFMWDFLGVPTQPLRIKPKDAAAKL
jgi:2-hydroxychromene-2-carboxylate isomerase